MLLNILIMIYRELETLQIPNWFLLLIIFVINNNPSMKKKILKFSTEVAKASDPDRLQINIVVEDEYFVKSLNMQKLMLPSQLKDRYDIKTQGRKIFFSSRANSPFDESADRESVESIFRQITVFHINEQMIQDSSDNDKDFKYKVNFYKNHGLIAFQKFYIANGRFQKGDFLLYSKNHIKQLIQQVRNFMSQEQLLFDLDPSLLQKQVQSKFLKVVTEKIVQQIRQKVNHAARQLQIKIVNLSPKIAQRQGFQRQKKPNNSIYLNIEGNRSKVHVLYSKIEQVINKLQLTIVQIDQQQSFPEENKELLFQIFPEGRGDVKIFKIMGTAVLILHRSLNQEEIAQAKKKLKLRQWVLDDIFTFQEMKILNLQYKNNQLKNFMTNRKVFWEKIEFRESFIKIRCDQSTKRKFIEHCNNLLKTFVYEKQQCPKFSDCLMVQIFKKYYHKVFQQKFDVKFEFGKDYIIRRNYTKYSDAIEQQLKTVRDKIKKKLVTLLSLKPVQKSVNLNSKLYQEVMTNTGYDHRLLGCCLYRIKSNKIKIKMKKLQSLKRQQQYLTLIFNNNIDNNSDFYKIIKTNQINLNSFLNDVHRVKKPERLRQYITEDSPFSSKTLLLHSGAQRLASTLKKDLQSMISLVEGRVCIALFDHEGQFLNDVFKAILDEILNQTAAIGSHYYQADFYYEEDSMLQKIQTILKKFKVPVEKISSFQLEQFDLQKIYALAYHTLQVQYKKQYYVLSPIIAELIGYELPKTVKKQQVAKKMIFSAYLPTNPPSQLVEFVINTKSQTIFKIIHNEDHSNWSRFPRIQKMQQIDDELKKIEEVIKKYFARINYIVVSAQYISDGLHGRKIKFCYDFYMVKAGQNWLYPVTLDIFAPRITQCLEKNKLQFKLEYKDVQNCYQITTFKEEVDIVSSFLGL